MSNLSGSAIASTHCLPGVSMMIGSWTILGKEFGLSSILSIFRGVALENKLEVSDVLKQGFVCYVHISGPWRGSIIPIVLHPPGFSDVPDSLRCASILEIWCLVYGFVATGLVRVSATVEFDCSVDFVLLFMTSAKIHTRNRPGQTDQLSSRSIPWSYSSRVNKAKAKTKIGGGNAATVASTSAKAHAESASPPTPKHVTSNDEQ